MERSKYSLIIFILFVYLNSSASEYSDRIYYAYVRGDMKQWKKTMDELEIRKNKTLSMWEELVSCQYGYIGYNLAIGNYGEAEIYVNKLDRLLNNPRILQNGMSEGYRAAWYGFKIALNKLKAPLLGPKSIEYSKMAMKVYPDCYFGYVQMGNFLLHTPSIFGGDKAKALIYFSKALNLYERQNLPVKNWNYLNLMVLVARTRYESGDNKGAIQLLQKILKIEPQFSWVRDELLPAISKGEKPNYIRNLEKYGYKE